MAKLQDGVAELFQVFKVAVNNSHVLDIMCNQCAAMLGQLAIETTDGDWKVSAKGVLSQANKNKAALPMNNPSSILYATALELRAIAKLRKVEHMNVSIPELCVDYVKELTKKHTAKAPEKATA